MSPGHDSAKNVTLNNQPCNLMQLNTISNLDNIILPALDINKNRLKQKWIPVNTTDSPPLYSQIRGIQSRTFPDLLLLFPISSYCLNGLK